jgi:Tfp pilus assembly protein PilF
MSRKSRKHRSSGDPSRERRGGAATSVTTSEVRRSDSPKVRRSWRQTLLIVVGLLAITIAVYAPVRHYDFVPIDDPVQVSENPQVTAGLTWPGVVWAFTSARAGYWMPLVWLSHMTDVQLYGLHAGPHHVTNLALHLACTLLLFGLLLRLTGATWRSALVAALFAVHPLHVESVAWITERKDVLSTLFWMLTLWAYVSWTRRHGWGRYALVLALFVLGLMAKPMLVTLPVVMLLLDVWPLGRLRLAGIRGQGSGRRSPRSPIPDPCTAAARQGVPAATWRVAVFDKVPLFALAGAGAVVAFVTQQQAGAVSNLQVYSLGLRVGNALVSYVAYIGKMFWPARLAVLYPFPDSIPASSVAGAIALLAAVSFVVMRLAARRPYLAVGWLWYLVTLLPVIGFVQVGVQAMADRFTYVPLIGLFIAIAWSLPDPLAARSVTRRVAVPVVAALVVLACAWTARAQVAYWKDGVRLWTRATELTLNMDAYHAHMSLGAVLRDQGRLDEAASHFSEAVRLNPRSAESHNGLATVLQRQGKMDQAIVHYQEALRLQPALAEVHNNLGAVLAQQGRFDEAIVQFSEAARLKPDLELAHVNLALAFARTDRPQDALREFNEVLRINPANEIARRAVGR